VPSVTPAWPVGRITSLWRGSGVGVMDPTPDGSPQHGQTDAQEEHMDGRTYRRSLAPCPHPMGNSLRLLGAAGGAFLQVCRTHRVPSDAALPTGPRTAPSQPTAQHRVGDLRSHLWLKATPPAAEF